MNKENIDIKKLKVIIFDFDETLAVHKEKEYLTLREKSEEALFDYYINAYLNPDTFYEEIEVCSALSSIKELVDISRNYGIKMYCVSGMSFSFNLKAKENFVHKYYGDDIEMVSAKSQESKINAVKIIARMNKCNLDEILFVDDLKENIDRFRKIGIHAILPDEIEYLIK